MGLIKAALGSSGGVLADQWKEFYCCDSMDSDVLVCKGQKKVSGRSSNTKGSSNIITNGSVIAVNEGQCMLIAEQGKIIDVCAQAGEFIYKNDIAPTIFEGGLGSGIKDSFKELAKRFSFGGEPSADQRIYFVNTKEISGNKYGTANPVPFRVVDQNIGLDIDISIRCNGEYSYKITNPLLFYTNVCANITDEFTRKEIDSQLKAELLTALQPAFAKISAMGVRYSALPGHTMEIANALNEILSKKWSELRGISIYSFGINSVTASEEDEKMIKELQKTAVMRNTSMAAAALTNAQADAMRSAAQNESGAMMGFMGMGMASNANRNLNAADLFNMSSRQESASSEAKQTWKCSCGAENIGKFCTECGAKKKELFWKCSCGAENKGKFCPECGAKKPAGAPLYKCDKCGWQPEDPENPPKFCPECGDIFNENDIESNQ